MAAVGVHLRHLTVLRRLAVEAVEHAVLHHRRGDGQVGARDALGDRDDVGRDVVVLVGEHLAGAAEAVDHLVDVQKDIVFAA